MQNIAAQQGPSNRGPRQLIGWILAALVLSSLALYWSGQRDPQTAAPKAEQPSISDKPAGGTDAQASTKVRRSDIVQKDGLYFLKGATQPFTGIMEDFYEHDVLKSRCSVTAGRLNGISEGWYTNGQQQIREQYAMGVRDGLQAKWYADGRKESETRFASGTFNGLYQRWHDNGALAYRVEYRAGKPDGLSRAYYPSGCLKAEVTSSNGQTVKRQTWKDGELKSADAHTERT